MRSVEVLDEVTLEDRLARASLCHFPRGPGEGEVLWK